MQNDADERPKKNRRPSARLRRKEPPMATDLTTDRLTESAEDLAKRFAALAARWKKETLHHSRMDKVAAHPAHREIIAMGEKVVPLILADLEKTLAPWFMALDEITGADPIP